MKKVLYFISLPFLLVTLNHHLCWAQQASGPKMVLEEKLFDAKVIKENSVIEHTFKIINQGDSPLEIKKVKPG
ncbi:hypothetical protein ACFL0H_06175 [Thermodesulfobacteriota bacterium]